MNLHDAWHIRLEAEREAKIKSLEKEIARLRLTDAEREAIDTAAHAAVQLYPLTGVGLAATLRGLLERLGIGGGHE